MAAMMLMLIKFNNGCDFSSRVSHNWIGFGKCTKPFMII